MSLITSSLGSYPSYYFSLFYFSSSLISLISTAFNGDLSFEEAKVLASAVELTLILAF